MVSPYRKDEHKELVLHDMPKGPDFNTTRKQCIWAGLTVGEVILCLAIYGVLAIPLYFWPGAAGYVYYSIVSLVLGYQFLESFESVGFNNLRDLYAAKMQDWHEEVDRWHQKRIDQIKAAGFEVEIKCEYVKVNYREFEIEVPTPKTS